MSTPPKDYTDAREQIPPDDRRRAAEEAWNSAKEANPEGEAEVTGEDGKPLRLDDFLVENLDTIDMSWDEIERLRKPVIVEGFLRHGTVMMLAAEAKSRKSWLAQDLGFAVRAGTPWLPIPDDSDEGFRGGFPTTKAVVHVLDLELDRDEMRFRNAKVCKNRYKNDRQGAVNVTRSLFPYSLDGRGVGDILNLITQLERRVKPGELVIVDCFYRMAPDANDPAVVAGILERLKRFTAATQCGMVIVDHFRKAGDDKSRNRIIGSAVKLFSAATLVSVEVKDDILQMEVDARTFHSGTFKISARFDTDDYIFVEVPEEEVEEAKEAAATSRHSRRLAQLFKERLSESLPTAEATQIWRTSKPTATKWLNDMEKAKLIESDDLGKPKGKVWRVTAKGMLCMDCKSQAA